MAQLFEESPSFSPLPSRSSAPPSLPRRLRHRQSSAPSFSQAVSPCLRGPSLPPMGPFSDPPLPLTAPGKIRGPYLWSLRDNRLKRGA
jgi:hypothetical protein